MSKTPEEQAREYADGFDDNPQTRQHARIDFLAGHKVGWNEALEAVAKDLRTFVEITDNVIENEGDIMEDKARERRIAYQYSLTAVEALKRRF